MNKLIAQIYNPVLQKGFGGAPGDKPEGALTNYIVHMWRTLIILGGLATLLFLLWGSLNWIMASGDQGKLESARKQITQAIIGMVILASSVALITFVGWVVGIDLLDLKN